MPFRGALLLGGEQSGRRERAKAVEGAAKSPLRLAESPFSPQSVVRICYIRSFGHFVARLQGSILQFNPEVGIFVSIAQSEQESLLQQAQAQFRMVSQPSLPWKFFPLGSAALVTLIQRTREPVCKPSKA